MDELHLAIRSFADMTKERALDVARAFDAHRYLRPRRAGGDPARIKVEPSMEAVMERVDLPIDWLTVRRNERDGAFESGQISLYPGRGAWMASYEKPGKPDFWLSGHEIEQAWVADTLAAEPYAVEDVARLFEDLVVASDAAWGCVLPWAWWPYPLNTVIDAALPGVYWLNYFGPAFVTRHPALVDVAGARTLGTGGVLVRTTDEPWQPFEKGTPHWQTELRGVFGERAFKWKRPNPALPTNEEHVAATAGTMDMPWLGWLEQKAVDDRRKKHSAAQRRLAKAIGDRPHPDLVTDPVEWSTSLDLEDWQEFARHLARKLRGEWSTAIGQAVVAVIANAPADARGSVRLDTVQGVVQVDWIMDDESTVDLYIWGASAVEEICEDWFS